MKVKCYNCMWEGDEENLVPVFKSNEPDDIVKACPECLLNEFLSKEDENPKLEPPKHFEYTYVLRHQSGIRSYFHNYEEAKECTYGHFLAEIIKTGEVNNIALFAIPVYYIGGDACGETITIYPLWNTSLKECLEKFEKENLSEVK